MRSGLTSLFLFFLKNFIFPLDIYTALPYIKVMKNTNAHKTKEKLMKATLINNTDGEREILGIITTDHGMTIKKAAGLLGIDLEQEIESQIPRFNIEMVEVEYSIDETCSYTIKGQMSYEGRTVDIDDVIEVAERSTEKALEAFLAKNEQYDFFGSLKTCDSETHGEKGATYCDQNENQTIEIDLI